MAMKINVFAIHEVGREFKVKSSDGWVRNLFKEILPNENPLPDQLKGEISIHRINDIVSLTGQFDIPFRPNCDLCLEPYNDQLVVPINMNLSPQYKPDKKTTKYKEVEEELELNADDLDFTFYEGDEIDLASLVSEQIVLALPATHICSPQCRGLCPQCGLNLNQSSCSCQHEIQPDSPWAVLKNLKLDFKKKP